MSLDELLGFEEVRWLVITLLVTCFYWVPYILNELLKAGIFQAMAHKSPWSIELDDWAQRARRAHANQVENLVVFAPLAILVPITGNSSELTGLAAMTFFFARLAHYLVYTFGIPLLRTLTFAVGLVCQIYLAIVLL